MLVSMSCTHFVTPAMQHDNANAVVSLRYPDLEDCTILVSKSNNRYRIQGTSWGALWLPFQEILSRLRTFFAGTGVQVSLEEQVPVEWYLNLIEDHFVLRQHRQKMLTELEQAATQVRACWFAAWQM